MAFEPFGEETTRPAPAVHAIGQDLSTLSLGELDERIEALMREVERLRQAKSAKQASLDAADSFFRRP